MGIRNFFYKDHPPVSGKAKKLWDWFIKEFDVENQDSLFLSINHPGMWQRSQGTSDYCIVYFGSDYVCKRTECIDRDGDTRVNGESWCVYDSAVGDGKDKVGSCRQIQRIRAKDVSLFVQNSRPTLPRQECDAEYFQALATSPVQAPRNCVQGYYQGQR